MQHYIAVRGILLVLLIETGNGGLNCEVGKAVGGRGKDIGNARVHVVIITRVGGQALGNGIWTDNVSQVIPEHNDLKVEWKGPNCEYNQENLEM